MEFLVTGKAIDAPMAPPQEAVAGYKASFEIFASGKDDRIKAVYPHADERACTLLVDVKTADELTTFLSGIPGFFLSTWEAHPVTTAKHVLRQLEEIEQALSARR